VLRADEDWRRELLERAGGGVDLVFDPVGGEHLIDNLRSLAVEGRLIVVGFAAGEIPQIPANRLLLNNTDVRGCTWGILAADPRGVGDAGAALNRLVRAGSVRPIVGATYALDAVADAIAHVRGRQSVGKTVLRIG